MYPQNMGFYLRISGFGLCRRYRKTGTVQRKDYHLIRGILIILFLIPAQIKINGETESNTFQDPLFPEILQSSG